MYEQWNSFKFNFHLCRWNWISQWLDTLMKLLTRCLTEFHFYYIKLRRKLLLRIVKWQNYLINAAETVSYSCTARMTLCCQLQSSNFTPMVFFTSYSYLIVSQAFWISGKEGHKNLQRYCYDDCNQLLAWKKIAMNFSLKFDHLSFDLNITVGLMCIISMIIVVF